MSDRRIKLVFHVIDADSGEKICDEMQCVMEFKQSELEHKIQTVRDKFPNMEAVALDRLVAPTHLGWAREIVSVGFLSVATYAKQRILQHLGYPTAIELLEKAQAR